MIYHAMSFTAGPSWPEAAEAIGSIAAVVVALLGFIFLWLQIQGLRKAIECETHGKIYTEDIELLKVFVDRPELRPYFYDNVVVDPESVDAGRVMQIAEMFCSHFEHVLLQVENLPIAVRRSWVEYARCLYKSSPAIREFYEAERGRNTFMPVMDEMTHVDGVAPASSSPSGLAPRGAASTSSAPAAAGLADPNLT